MDYKIWILSVILGTIVTINGTNHSDESAIILTGVPFYWMDYNHLTAITVPPREMYNFTGQNPALDLQEYDKLLISCQTDFEKRILYYYDYNFHSISLLENFNTDMDFATMNESLFQSAASKGFSMIAVDWVSHNVYWTEPIMGRIVIKKGGQNNDSTAHHVILSDLKRPRGIAVDPLAGYIFWTDIQSKTISRASLVGRNPVSLVYGRLSTPDSVAVDPPERTLYWTDEKAIYSVSYDGSSQRLFFRYSYAFFYDIDIIQDVIVATDINRYFAFFIDKYTGKEIAPRNKSTTEAYYGVCTYKNRTQAPPSEQDRCDGYGCQDICVSEPGKPEPTCLCRDGSKLTGDRKTCAATGYPYYRGIVLNTGNQLCVVGIHILSDHKDANTTCFYTAPENTSITHFDINMKSREVYFSIDSTIYSVEIDFVSNVARTITEQDTNIIGLTYDWMDNLVYYILATDPNSIVLESIWRVNPDTGSTVPVQMMTGFSPRAIAVSPHERKVFWITGDEYEGRIEYTDLSLPPTFEISTINTTYIITNVTHMYHDVKEESLYLLARDGDFHYVEKLEYNGLFSDYINMKIGISDFAIYKDYLITGFREESSLYVSLETADLKNSPGVNVVNSGTLEGIRSLVGIKVLDLEVLQPKYPDPCGNTNKKGECEQICLPEGNSTTCACHLGYILVNDKECMSYPVQDNFMLISDITYNQIYQIPLDDPTNIIAIRTSGVGQPGGVMFNYDRKIVMWANEEYGQILGMSLNGTVEDLITDFWFETPDRFAYDPSSQLLYFSSNSYIPLNGDDGFIGVMDKDGRQTTIASLAGNPRAIVLHPRKGLLFFTDHGTDAGVYRMQMDGKNLTQLISEDAIWPNGLTVDYQAELLYWADGALDTIFSCNFEGEQRVTIFKDEGSHMMALKLLDGYLYYSGWDIGQIKKVKIANTSDVTYLGSEHSLGRIHAMDIYVSGKTDTVPKHFECSRNNGGCSHFCLPNVGGHTCACEAGYGILNDRKTCENVPRCLPKVLTATINETDTCLRIEGNVCEFTCIENHRPKMGVSSLTCTSQYDPDFPEVLFWDQDDPCEEIFCPMTIPDGQLNMTSCSRKVDSDCVADYMCNTGYERNMDVTSLKCLPDGTWDLREPLCIAKCPAFSSVDNHALLHPTCTREIGTTCRYFCDDGFISSVTNDRVTCQQGSQWNATVNICQEIQCKDYIEGGVVNESCSLKLGAVCKYVCDFRFQANPQIRTITCVGDGVWNHGGTEADLLCTEISVISVQASNRKVGVGIGVGVAVLVLIAIAVIVLFYLYRAGHLPSQKKASKEPVIAFDNPRYIEDNVNIQPSTEASKEFNYVTLDEENTSKI